QSQVQIITDFAMSLSGSPMMNVLSSYNDPGSQMIVPNNFAVDWASVPHGMPGDDGMIHLSGDYTFFVEQAITNGMVRNPNDVYMVITDSLTTYTAKDHTPMCSPMCGAHGQDTNQSQFLFVGWVGHPSVCPHFAPAKDADHCILPPYRTSDHVGISP